MGSSQAYVSVSLSVHMSVYLSVWSSASPFVNHQIIARKCAQCMRPQCMRPQGIGSNILGDNIIFAPVRPYGCLREFSIFVSVFKSFNSRYDYYYHYYYHRWGPALMCIYPHTGVQRTPVGSSRPYMSICLSVCLSIWYSASLFGNQSAWNVILRSTCGRRAWVPQYNI